MGDRRNWDGTTGLKSCLEQAAAYYSAVRGCQILTSTNRSPRRLELPSEEIWELRKTCSNKRSLTSMRIITYSDLHLEFGSGWMLAPAVSGDVMILAGDIVTLRDYEPLDQILRMWKKPVLYVTGNHEYYTRRPMNEEDNKFRAWLEAKHPYVKLLLDEEVSIGGVNFFGGTFGLQRRRFARNGDRPLSNE